MKSVAGGHAARGEPAAGDRERRAATASEQGGSQAPGNHCVSEPFTGIANTDTPAEVRDARSSPAAARRHGGGCKLATALRTAEPLEGDGLGALAAVGVAEVADRVERRGALEGVAADQLRPGGDRDVVGHVGVGEEVDAGAVRVEDALERELVLLGEVGAVLDLDPAVLERVDESVPVRRLEEGAVGERAAADLVGSE